MISLVTHAPFREASHKAGFHIGQTFGALSGSVTRNAWAHGDYRRIYLYHIRKTGGTSVAFAFMRLAEIDPHLIEKRLARFAFAQGNGYRYVVGPRLIRQGNYFFAGNHSPFYMVEPPETGTFRFTILRDPVDRVVSLYRYLAAPAADSSFTSKAPIDESRWASEGFDRFLDRVPSFHLSNQLYMFSASGAVDEAVDRLGGLDMVLRTERLDCDLPRLESALNLSLSLSRERTSLFPFRPTSAQRDRLQDLLAPEYEMLRQIGLAP